MSSKLVLKIFIEPNGKCPTKGKPGDAGLDAYADLCTPVSATLSVSVNQGELVKIPLGFRYAFVERYTDVKYLNGQTISYTTERVSSDYWLDVRNRSGVGTKSGMATVAEVGDSNYRGVLHYCAAKITPGTFVVNHGDKIAQLLINPFVDPHKVDIEVVKSIEELGPSARGDSGFGDSGK